MPRSQHWLIVYFTLFMSNSVFINHLQQGLLLAQRTQLILLLSVISHCSDPELYARFQMCTELYTSQIITVFVFRY